MPPRHFAAAVTISRYPRSMHRNDLRAVEAYEDVVVGAERVLILFAERLVIRLDQALVLVDLMQRLAHRVALRAARLLDRQCEQMHRVVRVGDADRRDDAFGAAHLVLLLELGEHLPSGRLLVAEEA